MGENIKRVRQREEYKGSSREKGIERELER